MVYLQVECDSDKNPASRHDTVTAEQQWSSPYEVNEKTLKLRKGENNDRLVIRRLSLIVEMKGCIHLKCSFTQMSSGTDWVFAYTGERGENFSHSKTESDIADLLLWYTCLQEDVISKGTNLGRKEALLGYKQSAWNLIYILVYSVDRNLIWKEQWSLIYTDINRYIDL